MLYKTIKHFSKIKQAIFINPYTHQPLAPHPYLSQSELFSKITQAGASQQKWKQIPLESRMTKVRHFVDNIINSESVIRQNIIEATGKSYKHISEEFNRLKLIMDPLIRDGSQALKEKTFEERVGNKVINKKITFQPVGLALIFPYFSEPIFDSLIHLIPCLISGNGALIKQSDFNYFLGNFLTKKADESLGINGLVKDVYIHPDQLMDIKEFRSIKKMIYSGSQPTAKHIFQILAKNRFIDCNLFYGGQDAAYVDETADLQHAAKQICKYAYYNNGQSYDCIKRLYLHSSIQEQFIALLAQQISQISYGNPSDPSTDLGPLTIPEETMMFESLVNDAITDDASCVIGGLVTTDGTTNGLFCEPTLLRNCSSDMQIIQKQLNAPILCCISVENDQNFINEVNQIRYGTGLRIFTGQQKKYRNMVQNFEGGYISFNSGSITRKNLPIEGWKESGKGKILSLLSYQEYTRPKSYVVHN